MGVVTVVLVAWGVAFIAAKPLQLSRRCAPALRFAREELGVEFHGLHITWTTTALTGFLGRLGVAAAEIWDAWFGCGAAVCLVLMTANIVALTINLFWMVSQVVMWGLEPTRTKETGGSTDELFIQPLIPGVTLPWDHFPYLFVAIFIALVFHEIGHAIAAASCHLHIHNMGLILALCVPSAFVRIESFVTRMAPFQQLKVYMAGAWHNTCQAVLCMVLLASLPNLLRPLWTTCHDWHHKDCVWLAGVNGSVLEYSVRLPSPLQHVGVVRVNGISVSSKRQWSEALWGMVAAAGKAEYFCVSTAVLADQDSSCCRGNASASGDSEGTMCFTELRTGAGYCLPAREVALKWWNDSCCTHKGHSPAACLVLSLPEQENLIKVELTTGQELVFIDSLAHVLEEIKVLDFLPRDLPRSSTPVTGIYLDDPKPYLNALPPWVPSNLPHHASTFLFYLAAVSAGLVVVNTVPVHGFDGEQAVPPLLFLLHTLVLRGPSPPLLPTIELGSPSTTQSYQANRAAAVQYCQSTMSEEHVIRVYTESDGATGETNDFSSLLARHPAARDMVWGAFGGIDDLHLHMRVQELHRVSVGLGTFLLTSNVALSFFLATVQR